MGRIAAALRVRDDEDLIADAIANLRDVGVDTIIVIDEGSTDGTLDILAGLEPAGDLWIAHAEPWDPACVDLEVRLLSTLGAIWWLSPGADDRLLPRSGSLHMLTSIDAADVLEIERYPVALPVGADPTHDWADRGAIATTLVHAARVDAARPPHAWRPTPALLPQRPAPLRMVRAAAAGTRAGEILTRGERAGAGAVGDRSDDGLRWTTARDVIALRAAIASWPQFRRSVVALRERPTGWPAGARDLAPPWVLERLAALGQSEVVDAYDRERLRPPDLALLRAHGVIRPAAGVLDDRRSAPATSFVPAFADRDAYRAALASPDAWWPGFERARSEAGLDPGLSLRFLPGGKYPTAMVGSIALLKLFGPWRRGASAMAEEAAMLQAAAEDPELPLPRLLGTGWIDAEWSWLAMTALPGTTMSAVRPALRPTELLDAAAWVGDTIRRLHAVALGADVRAAALPRVVRAVRWSHGSARERQRAFGTLPDHLVNEIVDWLPSVESLLPAPETLVLTHADLHAENLLGTYRRDRFVLTGIIDLGKAGPGVADQELAAICGQVLRGGQAAIRTFLEHAAWPGRDDAGFGARALSWILLDGANQLANVPAARTAPDLDSLAESLFG